MKYKAGVAVLMLLFLFTIQDVHATHLRAGEITVEKINGCGSLSVRITITVFIDTESGIPFGSGNLYFGDGSEPFYIPDQESVPRPDLGENIGTASYTMEYTYASQGTYIIGYQENNRNDHIINVGNSVNTEFYVETKIVLNPFVGCNNSPVLLIPPIDRACTGSAFYHNPGAYDPDGDSLSYELVIPKRAPGTDVNSYGYPDTYSDSNEDETGPATYSIDPLTGELEWNAPSLAGEYTVAFIVREYRKINGQYVPLGYVTRDMQIIVDDCDNTRPELQLPEDICVEAGTVINEDILGFDPDNDSVKIEVFSETLFTGRVSYSPDPPVYQSSVPDGATLNFQWNTNCTDVRILPYTVTFKITDNPPPAGTPPVKQTRLVSFATWNITVVAPSPILTDIDQSGQDLTVEWDPYNMTCSDNLNNNIAEYFQIWRRIDSNPYSPDDCETGIRASAGYELIGQTPVNSTSFVDENLIPAAKFCYRIVAVFPETGVGRPESIVSNEICYEFVPADVPVITHVSVDKTGETDGEIIVGWREPFPADLNPATYPHPYIYTVQRSSGVGNTDFTDVGTLTVPSQTSDSLGFRDTGLNTKDLIYNYRIQLAIPSAPSGNDDPLFSEVASTVRLDPTPQLEQIRLDWSAQVPWSNVISTPPGSEHNIYRGPEGSTESDLVLIDKVDVSTNGFTYFDEGPLNENELYCYRVLTKGTYGNPIIKTPLYNYSQIICTQTSDTVPPCAPTIVLDNFSCDEFLANAQCGFNNFSNTLTWTTDFGEGCQNDVRQYQIYYKQTVNAEYQLIGTSNNETFVHSTDLNGDRLSSFKGCYKIKAIDRSGNESEFSNELCVDNCPYYELPNVFTPGNEDGLNCNDVFSAYGANLNISEGGMGPCGPIDSKKCARFVREVQFTVFNRWGGEVYTYHGTNPLSNEMDNSIYINWNGMDNSGKELSSGVYYYKAEVVFDVVDPSEATKIYKGWVHLIR